MTDAGHDHLSAIAVALANAVANASNTLTGDAGHDRLTGTAEAHAGFAVAGSNALDGGAGADTLLAEIIGFGSSELSGGPGDDHLSVIGGGENLLDGGPGRDRSQGGAGEDAFAITDDADTLFVEGDGAAATGGDMTTEVMVA